MHIVETVALVVLIAGIVILFFLVYRFRRNIEQQRRKYTVWDILGAVVIASVVIATMHFSDAYIYQPCGIHLSTETVWGRRAPFYSLVVLVIVIGLIVGRIRWFADHENWLLATTIAVSGAVIGLFWWRWCV